MTLRSVAFALVTLMTPAAAQTVDDIVARAITARGGAQRIKTVRTQRLTGRIALATDAPGAFSVEIRRPASIREEFTIGKDKVIRVSDGSAGWVKVADHDAVPLLPTEVKNMSNSADLDGPLLDFKERGNQIQYAGMQDVGGRRAFKLVIHQKDGQIRTDYIDTETFLELKWEGVINSEGKEYNVESLFTDYRDVSGVKCAFRITSVTHGTPIVQKIVFDRIEINPELEDERFRKP